MFLTHNISKWVIWLAFSLYSLKSQALFLWKIYHSDEDMSCSSNQEKEKKNLKRYNLFTILEIAQMIFTHCLVSAILPKQALKTTEKDGLACKQKERKVSLGESLSILRASPTFYVLQLPQLPSVLQQWHFSPVRENGCCLHPSTWNAFPTTSVNSQPFNFFPSRKSLLGHFCYLHLWQQVFSLLWHLPWLLLESSVFLLLIIVTPPPSRMSGTSSLLVVE